MKIALAHKRLDLAGGTERDFYRTAEGLRDLGHEVHLFCGEFGVPPPKGTQAHQVPVLGLGRTARLWSFAFIGPKVIPRHMCDVVVSFGRMVQQDILRSGGGSHLVFLQKMKQGEGFARRVWHRMSIYHRSVLAIERVQYRPHGYKKILAVSNEVKREIMTTYQVPEKKIVVIYNGVDHERFHPRRRDEARDKIRKQWSIPQQAPLVLFVGSGFQRKGLDQLLRAWNLPRLAGIYLLVVGEDAQRSRYVSWAERQAKGRVVFAGRQKEIEDYYGAADLLALPAFQEAFGNVVLEALASGLPVLVSRAAGAAEILTGELKKGILVAPDDLSEIEAKVLWMLDPARWPLLSEQARRLGEGYSWENHFRKLEKYLLEVAEQSHRGIFS
jgi:UDP-glucose:(heptosyl)LPS alpha-1,3-glucosyltransferase